MTEPDIIIIGSGPAGMSAAITAAQHNATVCIIDEQPDAGGQIYRGLARCSNVNAGHLGKERFWLARADEAIR